MIATCSHCQKKLKLSAKIEDSLQQLGPGKSLRVNCPQCGGAIILDFLSLTLEPATPPSVSPTPRASSKQVIPPPPPDLSGLDSNNQEGKATVEDVPKALILMPDTANCSLITEALESLGYQTTFVQSAEDAMERMQFINYASVLLHSHYEGDSLEKSTFHRFMQAMNMNKRRYIFYIITGPEFNTLYDLQALAHSANLVVNEQDLGQLALILRRAIPQYEGMFGAIMQEINALNR